MNRDNAIRIADLTEAYKAEAAQAADEAGKKLSLAEASSANKSADKLLASDLQKSAAHMSVVKKLADMTTELTHRLKSYQDNLAVFQEEAGQEILAGLNTHVELEGEIARLAFTISLIFLGEQPHSFASAV